jgi:acetyl esterase
MTGAIAGRPALAEGMDAYVALFTAPRAAGGPAAARLAADLTAKGFGWRYPPGMQVATSFVVGGGHEMAVRIYHPGRDVVRPALCYFHGGGFSLGSIETYDGLAAALAEMSGAVVVSAQYRRLPESSARAAHDDCFRALLWTAEHAAILGVAPDRIGVAGDSAGAMLAVAAALAARDGEDPPLCCQALLYGVFSLDRARACYREARDPVLTCDKVQGYIDLYNRCAADDPPDYPAPLAVRDLSRLPPAIVVGAEYDPLLDEAHEFCDRLRSAGVAASLHTAERMIHGFGRAVGVSQAARRELRAFADRLEPHLHP